MRFEPVTPLSKTLKIGESLFVQYCEYKDDRTHGGQFCTFPGETHLDDVCVYHSYKVKRKGKSKWYNKIGFNIKLKGNFWKNQICYMLHAGEFKYIMCRSTVYYSKEGYGSYRVAKV